MWFCRLHRKSSGLPSLWPQALAEALKVNKTVRNINLSGNYNIGFGGAEAWGSGKGAPLGSRKRCWAGVGPVLGLWILQKVSEMEWNQFGQFFTTFNLTDLVGRLEYWA